MMTPLAWAWILFNLFMVLMLVLDLKVFHRHAHEIKIKEAAGWSVFWISLAMLFMIPLYFFFQSQYDPALRLAAQQAGHPETMWVLGELTGSDAVVRYLTGYVVEQSLSVDNLFVFLLLFSYFKVPGKYQHRVLFWGILGAIVFRLTFILVGSELIHRFHWILYLFGLFLLFTGVKMVFKHGDQVDPSQNLVLRLAKKWLPMSDQYHQQHFFIRVDGRWVATLMFVVLLVVETTDVIFAVDSIPAIFGITQDRFLIYSSNVFAILGLRALFFTLAGLLGMFHLLYVGLAAILIFIGVKMLMETGHYYPSWGLPSYDIPTPVALGVIAAILGLSVAASLMWPKKQTQA